MAGSSDVSAKQAVSALGGHKTFVLAPHTDLVLCLLAIEPDAAGRYAQTYSYLLASRLLMKRSAVANVIPASGPGEKWFPKLMAVCQLIDREIDPGTVQGALRSPRHGLAG